MSGRDRSDEIPTLLDKATEVDAWERVGEIAADVIRTKLRKLRAVEAIVKDKGGCCAHCDSVALSSIRSVLS
jgi:hypothetical protein